MDDRDRRDLAAIWRVPFPRQQPLAHVLPDTFVRFTLSSLCWRKFHLAAAHCLLFQFLKRKCLLVPEFFRVTWSVQSISLFYLFFPPYVPKGCNLSFLVLTHWRWLLGSQGFSAVQPSQPALSDFSQLCELFWAESALTQCASSSR